MRTRVTAFVFLAFFLTTGTASAAQSEELRGHKFGTPLSSIKGLYKHSIADDLTFYLLEGEKPLYRGIIFENVLYGFKDGKLVAIDLWTPRSGPAYKYECTDIKTPSTDRLHKILKKNFGEPIARIDTNLTIDLHAIASELKDCNRLKAYNCIINQYEVEPPIDQTNSRVFTATMMTYQWIRQRAPEEFSPQERAAMSQGTFKGALDEYRCQHRIRFSEGPTREELEEADKEFEDLFRLFDVPNISK